MTEDEFKIEFFRRIILGTTDRRCNNCKHFTLTLRPWCKKHHSPPSTTTPNDEVTCSLFKPGLNQGIRRVFP